MNKTKKLLDLEGAAHIMGVRTSTLLALTKSVEGCPLGEAGLKYTQRHGEYFFTLPDLSEWLRRRLRNVNGSQNQLAA